MWGNPRVLGIQLANAVDEVEESKVGGKGRDIASNSLRREKKDGRGREGECYPNLLD